MTTSKNTPPVTAGNFLLKALTMEILTPSPLFDHTNYGLSFIDKMKLFQNMDLFISESLPQHDKSSLINTITPENQSLANHHPALFKKQVRHKK